MKILIHYMNVLYSSLCSLILEESIPDVNDEKTTKESLTKFFQNCHECSLLRSTFLYWCECAADCFDPLSGIILD